MSVSKSSARLEANSMQLIDRSRTVLFEFDGVVVEAYEGDTVASAMYAAGHRTFSRSFKYHRRRGLLCVAGRCPNCLVTVDGVPNSRACTKRVVSGMRVRHQNAWPSLDRDFLSVLDRLGRFMPVGFYYKTFHRPRFFWSLAQPIIRRVAGLGSLDMQSVPEARHHRHLHTEVAVVGGGLAGLSAGLAAAGAGAKVVLIDDQPNLGGRMCFDARTYRDIEGFDPAPAFEIRNRLVSSLRSSANIDILSDATVFGLYEGNLLGVFHENRLVKLRAKYIVVATGSYEVPVLFEGNDLPGVMLSTGAQRLMHLYGVKPGATAVVTTANDQGYYAALDLLEAGVNIAGVVDLRPGFPRDFEAAQVLKTRGILILTSQAVIRAVGKGRVIGAVVSRLEDGQLVGKERWLDCDIICMSGGFQPANSLLYQSGSQLSYDESSGEMVPHELAPTVYAAGEVTGVHEPAASILQGKLAGTEVARRLGRTAPGCEGEVERMRRELAMVEERLRSAGKVASTAAGFGHEKRRFVCICEDITAEDITYAIDEGFDDIQTLKRYTTATMGPCQGKMCLKSLVDVTAKHTGCSVDEIGVTTSRPPLQPVPLGALAGPSHMSIKRTPLDWKNKSLGALMTDVGPWQRAHSYIGPQQECKAVRERVGVIDVSTLGKLDVLGRDAPAFLDKIYTHYFSNLKVGRIRYGVLCADNGTILDDGTVTRLAEDHYFVTTTTGNIEAMEAWFRWWIAGTGMCVHIANVTSGFAAINVAGPRARDTLCKLTDIDLSPTTFRYMRSVRGVVAGVPTILLRIGFVGETGWELHFPAEYGEHMWEVLMEAGKEFDITPFGLEAQRILRLEKKHIIMGQETDAVTNPLESGMDWAVRFDKEDFIGKRGLLEVKERGLRNKLVGFVMKDEHVPDDGDPVMMDQVPIGRVTSARLSPTIGKGFGLAWVPLELSEEGTGIRIRVDGEILPAVVTMRPVYDPEGKRLRE